MDTEFAAPPSKHPIGGPEDFAELSRRMREGGLLNGRGRYYALKIPLTVGALCLMATVAVALGNTWWNLGVAVGLAFVLVQIGFIGHDAGHRQVCARRGSNEALGLVLTNLLSGFSFGWWLNKHNRHHAYTNREDKDPDIAAGALVYTASQVGLRARFGRWLAGRQSITIVPLLFLEALHLHLASLRALARRRDLAAVLEAGLLAVHFGVFFAAPFLLLSPVRAFVFVAVTQSLVGFYLGGTFLTNHVGMPTLTGSRGLGFVRHQVLTSRNLSGPLFTAFIFGGLDTQIEHHLFPAMPRANLRRARGVVRGFCEERHISYAELSPWCAYRAAFSHLSKVGNGQTTAVVD
jgi:fatty acid desaturase